VAAPLADKVTDEPMQMLWLLPALTVGSGFTVMVTCAVSLQPLPLVPTTVYVVVPVGFAVGLAQLVQDNPVAGDHT
jgi:hypothetical protein